MGTTKWKYPAFIRRGEDGDFGVYFPTLLGEVGWEYPLSTGTSKDKAIQEAKKKLAYVIASIIFDNDPVPDPVRIPHDHLSGNMELIEIEARFQNEFGTWNIYFDEPASDEETRFLDLNYKRIENFPNGWLLFTVNSKSEGEQKVHHFIENVLLPMRS